MDLATWERAGAGRVTMLHAFAKKLWKKEGMTVDALRQACRDAWDRLEGEFDTNILPLVPGEDVNYVNAIFGSGSFSTGKFQALQYKEVATYAPRPPVKLGALVANKSKEHGCGAREAGELAGVPLVELDFVDWYKDRHDASEENPVGATRYWYLPGSAGIPDQGELERRFEIRQDQFHVELGELVAANTGEDIHVASARGYNFQFCSNMFATQAFQPHVNDTHPADLSYVDATSKARLYPGWQAGAVQLMIDDGHARFRGSLIEVEPMDSLEQALQLDEGALLALGEGVTPGAGGAPASDIQSAMKALDDFTFCTLEPTGILLAWGITEDPVDVVYQDVDGNDVTVKQRMVVVGDKPRSGKTAWGIDLKADLDELGRFLLG